MLAFLGARMSDHCFITPYFSGRLDRKIELPNPDQEARARIMQIHSRKMNVSPHVNFDELSRCTDDYNGAMLKAVCVEAVSILQ